MARIELDLLGRALDHIVDAVALLAEAGRTPGAADGLGLVLADHHAGVRTQTRHLFKTTCQQACGQRQQQEGRAEGVEMFWHVSVVSTSCRQY